MTAASRASGASRNGRGQLVVIGTGLRTTGHFTTEALAWVQAADKVLYVVGDPVAEEVLRTLNPGGLETLQDCYGEGKPRIESYREMIARILGHVRAGRRVCAAFYGHPGVFVYPSHEAVKQARAEGYAAVMLPGVSAEDCLFADLGVDPAEAGCQSFEATDYLFTRRTIDPAASVVLWQIGVLGNATFTAGEYDRSMMPWLVEKLRNVYPRGHRVAVYEAAIQLGCLPRITWVPVEALVRVPMSAASTLYIPPARPREPDPRYASLAAYMDGA